MSNESCFHKLREGGIVRQLAPGITARVFPGVNVMLSVVSIEPHSSSPVHSHPNEQWGVGLEGEWIRIQDGKGHHVKAGEQHQQQCEHAHQASPSIHKAPHHPFHLFPVLAFSLRVDYFYKDLSAF
jgi:quercetin dioxygenase-like cupin family protein